MPAIKRYPNRKLYDTEAKRYITLDDIALLVREGRDVEVFDHDSGADVTDITLAQVAFLPTRERIGALPRTMLRHVIRFGDLPAEALRRRLRQLVEELRVAGELSQAGAERLLGLAVAEPADEIGVSSLVERQVGAAIRRLGLSSRDDLLALGAQVDALAQQLHDLESTAVSSE
jgi:polyhydroxyalkanoate synthesis repressor PhaR